jgi:hypothetical protein
MVADPLGKLGFRNGNCRPFFEFLKKSGMHVLDEPDS